MELEGVFLLAKKSHLFWLLDKVFDSLPNLKSTSLVINPI
jgi:hypothetical protein